MQFVNGEQFEDFFLWFFQFFYLNLIINTIKMDIVKEVLEKQRRELEKYKPITVEKHLDCELDVGMMLITDPNDLEDNELK